MNYLEERKNPRWQRRRLSIFQRDDFTCRFCGDKDSELHVHHLAYGKTVWGVSDDDLITLCRGCHAAIESVLKETRRRLTWDVFLAALEALIQLDKTGRGPEAFLVLNELRKKSTCPPE
jgi:5-methylcytosine-specific restriction endonuclease McrA